jgi:hypothetical protein
MPEKLVDAHQNHVTLSLYYGMRLLMVLAAVLFLIRGDVEAFGTTLFVALLASVPSFIKQRYRLYVPFALDLGIVMFIFLSLFLGGIDDFYGSIPLWDKIVHFQSGLLLSGTGFVLVYLLNESERTHIGLSPGFVAIFAVVFSLALGAVWEIAEFLGDMFFLSNWQKDLADTMWDLIADGVGAIVFSTGAYFWMYRYKRLPFTPIMLKIYARARRVADKIKSEIEGM